MLQASYAENGEGFHFKTANHAVVLGHLLPCKAKREDPRATPIHAASLANLPPATVVTAEFDILRDEGEPCRSAQRLAVLRKLCAARA